MVQNGVEWSGLALVVVISAVEFAGLHTTRASLSCLQALTSWPQIIELNTHL